jgi:hypothetical protein
VLNTRFQGSQEATNRGMLLNPLCKWFVSVLRREGIPMKEIWYHNKISRRSNFICNLPSRDMKWATLTVGRLKKGEKSVVLRSVGSRSDVQNQP